MDAPIVVIITIVAHDYSHNTVTHYYGAYLLNCFSLCLATIGGHHCPIELYWITDDFVQHPENFQRTSQLAASCSRNELLCDISILFMNFTERYNCPHQFTWKGNGKQYFVDYKYVTHITYLGGSGPPESINIEASSIDLYIFLVVFAIVCAGLLVTISFCFLNIKWRNNK